MADVKARGEEEFEEPVWKPPSVPMIASFPSEDGWTWIRVLLREKPEGMEEKPYWKAETARLRALHAELEDVSAFVVTSEDEALAMPVEDAFTLSPRALERLGELLHEPAPEPSDALIALMRKVPR